MTFILVGVGMIMGIFLFAFIIEGEKHDEKIRLEEKRILVEEIADAVVKKING